MTVFACACVTPAATDSAPIATNALAPAMAAATRNVCFFTSDQPPIDLIGLDLQCATRMSLYVILPVDSQLTRRRTLHRPGTASRKWSTLCSTSTLIAPSRAPNAKSRSGLTPPTNGARHEQPRIPPRRTHRHHNPLRRTTRLVRKPAPLQLNAADMHPRTPRPHVPATLQNRQKSPRGGALPRPGRPKLHPHHPPRSRTHTSPNLQGLFGARLRIRRIHRHPRIQDHPAGRTPPHPAGPRRASTHSVRYRGAVLNITQRDAKSRTSGSFHGGWP